MAARKVTGYIPKDPKTYVRAGIAASAFFLLLNTAANRVPALNRVRSSIFNGM